MAVMQLRPTLILYQCAKFGVYDIFDVYDVQHIKSLYPYISKFRYFISRFYFYW